MNDQENSESWFCPNCRKHNTDIYCSHCGLKKSEPERDYSFKYYVRKFVDEITDIESSKLYKTIIALFFRPGRIAADYLQGDKKKYINPAKIYLIVIVIYFLFNPTTQISESAPKDWQYLNDIYEQTQIISESSYDIFYIDFMENVNLIREGLMIFNLFLFAILSKLLFRKQNRFFGEHLIIFTYINSFFLIFLIPQIGLLT